MSNPTDKYRDLLQQSRDPENDLQALIIETNPAVFRVRFTVAIQTDAQYLLILHTAPKDASTTTPIFLRVSGGDFYNAAVSAKQEKTLMNGVSEYLKQRGTWEDIDSFNVEVYKLNHTPLLEVDCRVNNGKVYSIVGRCQLHMTRFEKR